MANKYFKRLSFEQVGADDADTITRVRKGIAREVTTPKYSVIVSTEGTNVYQRVDDNVLLGAVQNRNEIVSMIREKYPMVNLTRAQLALSTSYDYVNNSTYMTFDPDAGGGVIEVYE